MLPAQARSTSLSASALQMGRNWSPLWEVSESRQPARWQPKTVSSPQRILQPESLTAGPCYRAPEKVNGCSFRLPGSCRARDQCFDMTNASVSCDPEKSRLDKLLPCHEIYGPSQVIDPMSTASFTLYRWHLFSIGSSPALHCGERENISGIKIIRWDA